MDGGKPQTETDNFVVGSKYWTNNFEFGLGLGVGNVHNNPSPTKRPDLSFGVGNMYGVDNLEQSHGLDWMQGVEQIIDFDISKQIQEPSKAKAKSARWSGSKSLSSGRGAS